jgi:3'(2'), 5'-bisphosphate nucleotidase
VFTFLFAYIRISMRDFPINYKTALAAAVDASRAILEIYHKGFETKFKSDGSPVTEADLSSSKIISSHLYKTDIPIIGEERVNLEFEERKNWKQNWCVDPLDGTKEFVKRNGEFAVNIALIEDHKPIFGLIAEPCKGRIIAGGKGLGVYIWEYETDPDMELIVKISNTKTIEDEVVWIGSRSHPSADVNWEKILEINFSKVAKIAKGSAIKFFELTQENANIYPRFAPTMEWDIAAGQAIIEELGGTVVNAETLEPLTYNKKSLFNPNFVAKTKAYLIREKKFNTLRSI